MDRKGTILVVDDNLELAENLAEILSCSGYETRTAASAEAAQELLASGEFAAVITDFRLPGRTGAELISELRRAGKGIPVAVMSAYTDPAVIDQAETAGAVDVLPKPVDIARLLTLVGAMGAGSGEVLVVDDNRALAENLADAVRSCGLQAVAAELPPHVAPVEERAGLQIPGASIEELERYAIMKTLEATGGSTTRADSSGSSASSRATGRWPAWLATE